MWIDLDFNAKTINESRYIARINTDHIIGFNKEITPAGQDKYNCDLVNGKSFQVSERDYHKLLGLTDDEQDIPQQTTSKPSQLGELLNKLNKLLGGRGEARLTTDRKARLTTRLRDFTEDDLLIAAKNLGSDEFMQGANDNGKRYGTIDYLIRTSANVNKFLEEKPEKKKSLF